MFNLLEITQNNNIQVREKITHYFDDGEEAMSNYHRYTINSEQDLKDEPKLVKKFAKAFPYIKTMKHKDGVHTDIALIRIMANDQDQFRYDEMVHVIKDGETIASERKLPRIVKKGDDLTGLPEKVRKAAKILFK